MNSFIISVKALPSEFNGRSAAKLLSSQSDEAIKASLSPGNFESLIIYNRQPTSINGREYYYVSASKDEFIKLAPNPFINQLNFDFIVKGYQKLNIEVFDVATGTKVASQPNLTAGSRITLGQLSGGTYIIRVTSNDQKIVQQFKVVKM